MNEMTINFNGQDYIAKYNAQTGYYEVNLEAPAQGGIYEADIAFTDLLGQSYEDTQVIQIWAKEKIEIETNKVFMWIFDYKDFEVKDIVELSDYEINIDEETNANSIIKVLKKTTAKSRDIVAIKKNNEVVYWGIIDNIQNEDGKLLYEYTLKYITNIFDEEIPLNRRITDTDIEDGLYKIRFAKDTTKLVEVSNSSLLDNGNIQIWEDGDIATQKWQIQKVSDYYKIKNLNSQKVMNVENGSFQENTNISQYIDNNSTSERWSFENSSNGLLLIKTRNSNYYATVTEGSVENGTNLKINILQSSSDVEKQEFVLEKLEQQIIKETGIEDYIAKVMQDYFINSDDELMNKKYLEIRVKSHTKLQTTVSNVTDNMYNLHTWMTNCTQLYNIMFTIYIENKKLIIEIENKSLNKELVDVNAQQISGYTEVFETNIVCKVEVFTDTKTYNLYLLNDRTTTTDKTNINRADGKTERVYTSNYEDAEQKALDTIRANTYNHNITFKYLNRIMKVGTPIAIKTKESLIHDTYISAMKLTQNKFIEYTCGNIRIKFIDKLLKERRNK